MDDTFRNRLDVIIVLLWALLGVELLSLDDPLADVVFASLVLLGALVLVLRVASDTD